MIVTWTTEPTGPAAGQTVIDEFGGSEPVAVAHPAAEDVIVGVGAVVTGAEAVGVVAGEAALGDVAVDGAVAGNVVAEALGRVVAVPRADGAEEFEAQAASTPVTAQAMAKMATDRRVDITGLPQFGENELYLL